MKRILCILALSSVVLLAQKAGAQTLAAGITFSQTQDAGSTAVSINLDVQTQQELSATNTQTTQNNIDQSLGFYSSAPATLIGPLYYWSNPGFGTPLTFAITASSSNYITVTNGSSVPVIYHLILQSTNESGGTDLEYGPDATIASNQTGNVYFPTFSVTFNSLTYFQPIPAYGAPSAFSVILSGNE